MGGILVPAKVFSDIVKKLDDNACITMKQNEQYFLDLTTSSGFKSQLMGLNPDTFPTLDFSRDDMVFEAKAKPLSDALAKVLNAVSKNNRQSNYNLTGINMSLEDEQLLLASTDNSKLCVIKMPYNINVGFFKDTPNLLFSKNSLAELRKLCLKSSLSVVEVTAKATGNIVTATINEKGFKTQLSMNLLNGTFPNYKSIVNFDKYQYLAIVNKDTIYATIRRLATICDDKYQVLKLCFSVDELKITVNNPTIGSCEETIKIKYDGLSKFNIGVDYEHLEQIFSIMHSKDIHIAHGDNTLPLKITGPDDPGYLSVISVITPREELC
jgi:DNA polymerase-3 subunit beta